MFDKSSCKTKDKISLKVPVYKNGLGALILWIPSKAEWSVNSK